MSPKDPKYNEQMITFYEQNYFSEIRSLGVTVHSKLSRLNQWQLSLNLNNKTGSYYM